MNPELAPAFARRRRAGRRGARERRWYRWGGGIAVALAVAAWDPFSWFGPAAPAPLSAADVIAFETRKAARLHRYRDAFEAAADRHGVGWKLIAAVAYQESQWQPHAVSRTGVRGLMMLTRVTAHDMGISDRLDPAQSIDGGAKYLRWLLERTPAGAGPETRTALALASYHAGLNRVHKAWQASGSQRWRDFARALGGREAGACAEPRPQGCELLLASLEYVRRVLAFRALL